MPDLHRATDQGWIGVGLDGTLAHYNGWKGPDHIGAPIKPMIVRVLGWLLRGKTIKVVTARVHPSRSDAAQGRAAIEAWLVENLGRPLEITHEKDPQMIELWDDMVVQVVPNTGIRADSFVTCCPRAADRPCDGCDRRVMRP